MNLEAGGWGEEGQVDEQDRRQSGLWAGDSHRVRVRVGYTEEKKPQVQDVGGASGEMKPPAETSPKPPGKSIPRYQWLQSYVMLDHSFQTSKLDVRWKNSR